MSLPLTVNGLTFQYPEPQDEDWGAAATGWATAVTNLLFSFRSATLPIADDGKIRLGNGDEICWRNFANTSNVCIYLDNLNRLILDDGVTQKDLGLTGASGNVQHLSPSLDNEIVRFDGTLGTVIQTSGIFIDDSQNITGAADVLASGSITGSDIDVTGDIIFDATNIELSKALPPIGTIIWHYDFNGALVPNSAYWVPCDGSSQIIGGVSRTTPDLSARYIVGFGTEGGGNIDTDPFVTAPVGNASHQINLAHTHTVDNHDHGIPSEAGHSHIVNAHTHNGDTLAARIAFSAGGSRIDIQQVATNNWTSNHRIAGTGDDGNAGGTFGEGAEIDGVTQSASPGTSTSNAHDHGGFTFPSNPGTNSQLSATQSIQPRSIRARAFMRSK